MRLCVLLSVNFLVLTKVVENTTLHNKNEAKKVENNKCNKLNYYFLKPPICSALRFEEETKSLVTYFEN